MASAAFTHLSSTKALLGESPVWSAQDNAVWWVDITGRMLHRTRLDGSTQSWTTPETPGFVEIADSQAFIGMESGIFSFDPADGIFERVAKSTISGQRFNDACTDAHGRIWAGTMDHGSAQPNGVLYLFDPRSHSLTPKMENLYRPNGLAHDANRNRLYVSDSHPDAQTAWTCTLDDTDTLGERQVFARFHNHAGRPDGATLDATGDYWIAGVSGGELYRFSPEGLLRTTFQTPMPSPSKPLILNDGGAAIVLTSIQVDGEGGELTIWRDAPNDII